MENTSLGIRSSDFFYDTSLSIECRRHSQFVNRYL